MLPELQHYPVNWVDGMKIARQHFTEFEHFVSDHLRDANAVGSSSYTYGLLASAPHKFSMQVTPDLNQNLRVVLTNCRAVTGSGCRIELVNTSVELATSLNDVLARFNIPMANELEFLLVLSIDLFNRKPVGQPSATEGFPRPPFSQPTYWLSMVPRHQNDTPPGQSTPYRSSEFESFHLVIGQLSCKYGRLANNDQYIPACTSVNAHEGLRSWADETRKLLSEVQRDAFLIVRKVCEKRGSDDARKAGVMAELIGHLCQQLTADLDAPLNQFGFTAYEQPPIYLIEAITLATRRFQTTLTNLSHPSMTSGVRMGDQLVCKYFQDWTGITFDRLTKEDLATTINRRYDHTDLRPHLQLITQCWTDIAKIMNELTKLDYIGQEQQDIRIRDRSQVTNPNQVPGHLPPIPQGDGATTPFKFTSR